MKGLDVLCLGHVFVMFQDILLHKLGARLDMHIPLLVERNSNTVECQ